MIYSICCGFLQIGEEINDMYSMHYSEIPKSTRYEWLLEKFLFHCGCSACKEEWPTYDELPKVILSYFSLVVSHNLEYNFNQLSIY